MLPWPSLNKHTRKKTLHSKRCLHNLDAYACASYQRGDDVAECSERQINFCGLFEPLALGTGFGLPLGALLGSAIAAIQ